MRILTHDLGKKTEINESQVDRSKIVYKEMRANIYYTKYVKKMLLIVRREGKT